MKRRAIVMVAALALAGGACGGDDDDATDDAAVTTDGSNGDADSGDGDDDSGGGEWCDVARDLETNTLLDDVDIDDPDAIENAFEEMIDLAEEAADSAPDEIKDDLEFLVEESRDLVDALREVDFDFEAIDPSILADPESIAAGERVDEYSVRVCGIESDTGDTGG